MRIRICLVLVLAALFVACAGGPVCDEPYVLVGDVCCLDQDGGGVCDVDEASTSTSSTSTSSTTTSSLVTTSSTSTTSSVPVSVCYSDGDCGVNGTKVVKMYTCRDGDVFRQYVDFSCRNPGSADALCVGREKFDLVKACGSNDCVEGVPYCRLSVWGEVSEYGELCYGLNCVRVNSSEQVFYKTPASWFYAFRINYLLSSPRGVSVEVQRPNGSVSDVFLVFNQREEFDGLVLVLKQIVTGVSLEESYVRILVSPPSSSSTSTTLEESSTCVPPFAYELVGLNSYDFLSYVGYGFLLEDVVYVDDGVDSVVVLVKEPDGSVVRVELAPGSVVGVGKLFVGMCLQSPRKPKVWISAV